MLFITEVNMAKNHRSYARTNVQRAINKIKIKRGKQNEDRAVILINQLEEKPSWLRLAKKASQEQDQRGIDLIMVTDVGELYIQLKSSQLAAKLFLVDHPRFRGEVVVIHMTDDDASIAKKIVRATSRLREKFFQDRISW